MARRLLAGLLAAVAGGLALGVLARALMRVVAVAAGAPGSFSWSGTAGVLLVFVLAAVPGALLAAASTRRWRSALLVASAALLLVPATGVAEEEVGDLGAFGAWRQAAVLTASAGVYATVLGLPLLVLRLVDGLTGEGRRAAGPVAAPVEQPLPG